MAHLSLYRKYRSQTFSDLVGQDHVVRTLQNGITTGRIAHSYLFTGPRGTGKTSSARLLAKALCCENGPTGEPDNTCHICQAITEGSCVDVLELDAASDAGVEDVRDRIVDVVEYLPMICRYKIFIIDEVHDLSTKAFDALLKTIEEPPPHIIFILATTEFNKVPPTIRSRCQKFEFHRASMQDLVNRINYVAESEGVKIDPAAVTAIARMADGGYRDALTLLEQAMVTAGEVITVEHVYEQLGLLNEDTVDSLLLAMKEGEVPRIMELLSEVARHGRDPRAILESMMYRLSDLTRASYQVAIGAPDAMTEAALHAAATRIGREPLLRIRTEIAEAHKVIRDISLPRLWLEAELVRIALEGSQEAAAPERPRPPREAVPALRSTPPTERRLAEPKPAAAAPKEAEPTPQSVPQGAGFWTAAIKDLTAMSRTLGQKLVGTRIASDEGGSIVIEFSKETFYDWVREKPKVVSEIVRAVSDAKGAACTVEFSLRREDTNGSAEHVAVELPAEGQRLEQLAKEVFGI